MTDEAKRFRESLWAYAAIPKQVAYHCGRIVTIVKANLRDRELKVTRFHETAIQIEW